MRRILIVGAGQAGLQLALGLLGEGYDVTVMSARTPEEIRAGRVMSTQVMFAAAMEVERRLGLDQWQPATPQIEAIRVSAGAPPDAPAGGGAPALRFTGPFDGPAQSVDQRVKMAGWLELFTARGGNTVYHPVTTSELEALAALYDLTVIAAGKGELVELFDRDASRSPFTAPQRALSVIYLHGVRPDPDHPAPHVGINVVPGAGELFEIPALTVTGPSDILFWEAIPGQALDVWGERRPLRPDQHLERALDLARRHTPWILDRYADAEPADARCTLTGAYPPVVRHPVGRPAAGTLVLGMADVVVANDPIAGQGANNAAHCADIYLRSIVEHGGRPYDEAWMRRTFDAYWDYAQWSTAWSNALLGPMPEHVQRVIGAAAEHPAVARRFAASYATPRDLEHWLLDPAKTDAYLASVASSAPSEATAAGPV